MNRSSSQVLKLNYLTAKIGKSRGMLFGLLIIGALLAFELFNYTTTEFALNDLLGGLRFAGIRWATILAIAFCGIDFAGIARLFTPQQGSNEAKETWYLFGAWLLAASMNAMLTWWGVALAISNHESLGGTVVARETLVQVVPIFVAIMVWLIRVLIIGTFSVAGDRLYSQADTSYHHSKLTPTVNPAEVASRSSQQQPVSFHPSPKSPPQPNQMPLSTPNTTYRPVGMTGCNGNDNQTQQQF
jgi:hypothetical protein